MLSLVDSLPVSMMGREAANKDSDKATKGTREVRDFMMDGDKLSQMSVPLEMSLYPRGIS